MYSELQLERIGETIAALEKRIGERFPGSGLSRVAAELHRLADRTGAVVERLRRPVWILRIAAAIGIAAILGVSVAVAFLGLRTSIRVQSVLDVLQGSEVAINDIILISAAIFFFLTLETRVKRRAARTASSAQHRAHRRHAPTQ